MSKKRFLTIAVLAALTLSNGCHSFRKQDDFSSLTQPTSTPLVAEQVSFTSKTRDGAMKVGKWTAMTLGVVAIGALWVTGNLGE